MLFAVGSSQGTTGCIDIVVANNTVSEGLECFSLSLNNVAVSNVEVPLRFVPVCIKDDDRT